MNSSSILYSVYAVSAINSFTAACVVLFIKWERKRRNRIHTKVESSIIAFVCQDEWKALHASFVFVDSC